MENVVNFQTFENVSCLTHIADSLKFYRRKTLPNELLSIEAIFNLHDAGIKLEDLKPWLSSGRFILQKTSATFSFDQLVILGSYANLSGITPSSQEGKKILERYKRYVKEEKLLEIF